MQGLNLRSLALTSSLLLILLVGTASAQVVAKDQFFVLNDFSGGLNNKISPLSLPKKQGDIVENVRFDSELRSFTKRDKLILYGTADTEEPITGIHRLYTSAGNKYMLVTHGNEVEKGNDTTGAFTSIMSLLSDGYRFQWDTWHDLAIGTDGQSQPIKCDGSDACTYLGSALATDAGSGSGPNGVYSYKVSCYTTSYEVSLGQASNEITVTDNDIDLTLIPLCPTTYGGEDVIGRKIYRTEASGSTYNLLTNGTIANNTATTLTDSDADAALGTTLSPTVTYQPPKGELILVHRNRLWIANDPSYPSRIYYSEDGLQDYFESDNYFNIRTNDGDEITFIKIILGNLAISKNNTIQYLYTDEDDPDDWAISDPFSFIGCQAPYSAVNTPWGIIYLANNGIYRFTGQKSELISDNVTPSIRDISFSSYSHVWGEYYKNKYFMAYTSESTGSSTNNRILILDLLTQSFSIDRISANVLSVFSSGSDVEVLYSGSSDDGEIHAHAETLKELVHNKHTDFTGTWDDMRYIPTGVGGNEEDPILELAWTETIDEMVGTIDSITGIIDRPDTDGSYISQFLTLGANTFDRLYWNETLPASGGNVTFALRSGATTADCSTSGNWYATEFTDPTGADISDATADTVVQYRISMSTDNINYTPNLTKGGNYVVRMTYNTIGVTDETSIPVRWRTGWLDLEHPGYVKSLKKLNVYYDTDNDITAGTLDINFENYEGDTDSFSIDLYDNQSGYTEYFTGGKFIGELFRIDIQENSLDDFTFKELLIVYDIEPLY